MVTIEIEHQSGENGFHTRYKVEKYGSTAQQLAGLLHQQLTDEGIPYVVSINPGPGNGYNPIEGVQSWYAHPKDYTVRCRYPRLGAFEVVVKNLLAPLPQQIEVFSKIRSSLWPNPERLAGRIVELISRANKKEDCQEQLTYFIAKDTKDAANEDQGMTALEKTTKDSRKPRLTLKRMNFGPKQEYLGKTTPRSADDQGRSSISDTSSLDLDFDFQFGGYKAIDGGISRASTAAPAFHSVASESIIDCLAASVSQRGAQYAQHAQHTPRLVAVPESHPVRLTHVDFSDSGSAFDEGQLKAVRIRPQSAPYQQKVSAPDPQVVSNSQVGGLARPSTAHAASSPKAAPGASAPPERAERAQSAARPVSAMDHRPRDEGSPRRHLPGPGPGPAPPAGAAGAAAAASARPHSARVRLHAPTGFAASLSPLMQATLAEQVKYGQSQKLGTMQLPWAGKQASVCSTDGRTKQNAQRFEDATRKGYMAGLAQQHVERTFTNRGLENFLRN